MTQTPFRRRGFPAAFLLLLAAAAASFGKAGRFFRPAEGFTLARDLPEDFTATVRSIQLGINDVFEGSTVHSEAEAAMFDIGNRLHIETRPGAVRRRLLFREGDTVTANLLVEAEKALRSEEFLADAFIEVRKWEDGTAHVIVTTWDQWTTTLAFTPQVSGGNFYYQAGVVESNVLGSGQRLGFFITDARERDMRLIDYKNKALTPWRLRLGSYYAWLSDGYSAQFSLSKPLESRASRHAFNLSLSAEQISEYVYFDANRLDTLPAADAERLAGKPHFLAKFDKVASHAASASYTRSFGGRTKVDLSPVLNWNERYNHGDTATSPLLPADPTARFPEERYDVIASLSASLYRYDSKTVHNYRNLKWSENLDVGWRLSAKVGRNQAWLGARNRDFYLSHGAAYNNSWWNALFLASSASVKYFISPRGDFDNGSADISGDLQWKPVPAVSTTLSAVYGGLFAAEGTQQLLLGEDSGLNGYPNAYYAGQARVLVEAEQRYFPGFEFGTLVPAVALFGNAGNTFPHADQVDLADLHYAVGIGLRLALTKTVQKLVWHINLSQPVGEEYLEGPRFSFRVKLGL